jgi:hypothetical protein
LFTVALPVLINLCSNTCGTVFCRVQEVDRDVRSSEQDMEIINAKPNRVKVRKILGKEEEYDISKNLRKFRRIRIINPPVIGVSQQRRNMNPSWTIYMQAAYCVKKTTKNGKRIYVCSDPGCGMVRVALIIIKILLTW